MARTTRVELNRRALGELAMAFVDGVFEVSKAIVEEAGRNAPDSPLPPYPLGEGLPKQGGVLVYVGPKQVHAWSLDGSKPKKPRAVKVRTEAGNIFGIAGFGHPGRFQELGTAHHRAQPFLTPAVSTVGPSVPSILNRVVRPKLR